MEVRTVGELLNMLSGMQSDAMQGAAQLQQSGPIPAQPYVPGQVTDFQPQPYVPGQVTDYQPQEYYDPGQGIADAILSSAGSLFGGVIRRRMQRNFEQRMMPALRAQQDQAEQSRRLAGQSTQDQAAIVERYPDLRGCTRDQVLFLAGGTGVVPFSELSLPITLAQADAVVARLRAS